MANDFKIVLSTTLDTSQIQKQLDDLSKKATVNISSSSGTNSPLKTTLDDVQKLGKLQEQAYQEDARRTAQKQADIQRLGNMQIQAAEMNLKFDQEEIQAQEKLNAEFAKYQQQVDVFLAKTQNRDLSKPGASEALNVRTDMQGVLNGQATPEAVVQLDALGNKAKIADANFQGLNATTQTFNEKLLQTIKSSVQTALSIGLIYGALNQLKEGIQYVVDLNKEMTNIQLVTGQTSESLNGLALQYNRMAGDLGSTTLQIAKTSTEFIRQGKTAEETAVLIRNSTMLQKLGNMEAADATEKLTAIMNGQVIAVKDSGEVIDKLVNNTARTYSNVWKFNLDRNSNICYS